MDLVTDDKIGKLSVAELNKYLIHHKLPLKGKKADKVRTIVAHLSKEVLNRQMWLLNIVMKKMILMTL